MMKASNDCLAAIRKFEGYKDTAYKCPAGEWTIGYGHTRGVKYAQKITKAKAEEFLREDVERVESDLAKLGFPSLNQRQHDALVDFLFNLGVTKTRNSTLFKFIRENKTQLLIIREFMRWVYSNGVVLDGLVTRRQWEAEQWCGLPVYYNEDRHQWFIDKNKIL